MKLTFNWLKKHIDTDLNIDQIINLLTDAGLEVEEVKDFSVIYKPFVIAQILEAHPHPQADKLRVCKVTDGKNTMQIVCGAPNARAGIKVVLAPIGAEIPANKMVIRAASIRGVESSGMMCSASELELGEEDGGIIELPENAPVGASFAEYYGLNDAVIEISLTPNRGDAASVYGIGRDLYALGTGVLKPLPDIKSINASTEVKLQNLVPDMCSEFTLTYIQDVKNKQNLDNEISKFLKLLGSSNQSALVSLSNFAMLEYGRPNHIYDADKIKGLVKIRKSSEGEEFIALGNIALKLPEGLCVIADEEKVLAVAGVIGGELSKVDLATKNIAVEVANFDAKAVARAGRLLNIITDSRFRFERRVDMDNTEFFKSYLCDLIMQNCGGKLIGSVSVNGDAPAFPPAVSVDREYIRSMAGVEISNDEINKILIRLGFEIEGDVAKVPSYRLGDIVNKADIAEEVIRIYGLNKLPKHSIPISFTGNLELEYSKMQDVRSLLVSNGFIEHMTFAFVSEELADLFAFTKDRLNVVNPISKDLTVMRQSLLPSLLLQVKNNIIRGVKDLQLFEIGKTYQQEKENNVITGLLCGKFERKSIFNAERNYDFFDSKKYFELVVARLGFDYSRFELKRDVPEFFHPGKAAAFFLGKNLVGYCGEAHPKVRAHFGLKEPIMLFEVFVDNIPLPKGKKSKQPLILSNLQMVERDFAFLVDDDISAASIVRTVRSADKRIESVRVFDLYKDEKLGDKKSMAITVQLKPVEETFTETQIEEICQKITLLLQKEYSIALRS